ncbi:hypothetical protein AAE478_006269 [Parahypoxylon ruwenzoriense]
MNRTSRPESSRSRQSALPSLTEDEIDEAVKKDSDWLAATVTDIKRDLKTSARELELIKEEIENLEIRLREQTEYSPELRDRKSLLGACHEYSISRCQILEERLRKVQFWLNNKQTGKDFPDRMPEEWHKFDLEWRQWLGEKAAAYTDESGENPQVKAEDMVRLWGPLFALLMSYTD